MSRIRHLGPRTRPADAAPDRLDRALAETFAISRGEARRIIATGGAHLNGKRCKVASRPCGPGDVVDVYLADGDEEFDAPRVVYTDGRLAVLDKPAGMPVAATRHSDRGHLEAWATDHFGCRVHLPQRLDRRASGLMLVVLDPAFNRAVARAFERREVVREYRVRVVAEPPRDEDRLEGDLDGRPASLHYRLTGPRELRVRLETGRFHQIRRQLAAIGCPVEGDPRYGGTAGPLQLRAVWLAFTHPGTGERLELEAE